MGGCRARGAGAAVPPRRPPDRPSPFIPSPRLPASWSALSRRDRYLARSAASAPGDGGATGGGPGGAGGAAAADEDAVLPGHVDPVTLEPVVAPAISPFGHVMGLATWRAVLSEGRGCPFTKRPLRVDELVVLTRHNVERYRRLIVTA
jgi:hypothetical protein